MSGNNNKKDQQNNKLDLSMIKDFIDIQKEKISLEKSELELKKQHLKHHADLAKQTLSIQEKLLEKEPREKRKNRYQIFIFSVIIAIIILGFSVFCLLYKYEKFLNYFIGTLSHIGVLALGYYFGKQNKKGRNEDPEIQDAEIID